MEALNQNTNSNVITTNHNSMQQYTLLFQDKSGDAFNGDLFKQLSKHKHCLKQKRWILLLAPENIPTVRQLNEYGIDEKRILVVNKSQISGADNLVARALNSGSFSAVLSWLPNSNSEENSKDLISEIIRQTFSLQADEFNKKALRQIH